MTDSRSEPTDDQLQPIGNLTPLLSNELWEKISQWSSYQDINHLRLSCKSAYNHEHLKRIHKRKIFDTINYVISEQRYYFYSPTTGVWSWDQDQNPVPTQVQLRYEKNIFWKFCGFFANTFAANMSHQMCMEVPTTPLTTHENLKIIKMVSGDKHQLFLTAEGEVYAQGSNEFGQIGGAKLTEDNALHRINHFTNFKIKIIDVIAGNNYSYFVSSENQIYACGYNISGQLANHRRNQFTALNLFFLESQPSKPIRQIATASSHTAILFGDDDLQVAGDNSFGQLGIPTHHATTRISLSACRFFADNDLKIKTIVVGKIHTLYLCENQKVYVCGSNLNGQLGLIKTYPVNFIEPLNFFYDNNLRLKKIVAGDYYTVFLCQNGKVYVCGDNREGQLGLNNHSEQNELQLQPYFSLHAKTLKVLDVTARNNIVLYHCDDEKIYQFNKKSTTPIIVALPNFTPDAASLSPKISP